MFTGIVENTARVILMDTSPKGALLKIQSRFQHLALGESVAINGVCLTVTEFDPSQGTSFFLSPETLSRSNLGTLRTDSSVNLERALSVSAGLSGHIVQGHVDGLAVLTQL